MKQSSRRSSKISIMVAQTVVGAKATRMVGDSTTNTSVKSAKNHIVKIVLLNAKEK